MFPNEDLDLQRHLPDALSGNTVELARDSHQLRGVNAFSRLQRRIHPADKLERLTRYITSSIESRSHPAPWLRQNTNPSSSLLAA